MAGDYGDGDGDRDDGDDDEFLTSPNFLNAGGNSFWLGYLFFKMENLV